MRRTAAFTIFFLVLPGGFPPSAMGRDLQPTEINIMQWPRMEAASFGCYMEKTLGYRDPRFNCSLKKYRNKGDPCRNTDAYYEGPSFPAKLTAKIQPQTTSIDLSWEHGELQMVTLTLQGAFDDRDVRRVFRLAAPGSEAASARNVMSIDIAHDNPGITLVTLMGFDHQGAGDVDCGQ